MSQLKNIEQYNLDIEQHGGYAYAQSQQLSTRLALQTLSRAVAENTDLKGKKVIDVGCGDGTFTQELLNQDPDYVLGIDAAEKAIDLAKRQVSPYRNAEFVVGDVYDELVKMRDVYDVAILRGILHHLDDPLKVIFYLSQVVQEIVVIEPNGYNMILKVIEKTSKYHIEHDEKSYFPHKLHAWLNQCQGRIEKKGYYGIVPFFCPDFLARICKFIEPVVERMPVMNALSCAVYVLKVRTAVIK